MVLELELNQKISDLTEKRKKNVKKVRSDLKKLNSDTNPDKPKKTFPKYSINDKLEEFLNNDNIKEKTKEDGYIKASELASIINKYFKNKNNGVISFTNTETPVYKLFSEYFDEMENETMDSKYKPSEETLTNLEKLKFAQLTGISNKFLLWMKK